MATYAYARISVDDAQSVSVDDQLAKIKAHAFASDREVVATFVDRGVSGKTLERPSAKELLNTVKRGDTIVVYRLDRLTRSVRDINAVLDLGVTLVSITESLDTSTAAGRMVINMIATFAQYERELIVERTTASLARKRQQGSTYCFAPFGYRNVEGRLMPLANEQALIDQMTAMRAGGSSYEAVAKMANASRIKPHRGKMWYAASIKAVLDAKIRGAVA